MKTGTYISGLAHIGLIGWVLIGDVFSSDPPEPSVTDVSVISATEFDAMFADTVAPEIAIDLATMAPAPDEDLLDQPVELSEDLAPSFEDVTDTEAPEEEAQPDVSGVQPVPDAEVSFDAPTMALPSFETGPDIEIDDSDEPQPREAPRVAPIPTLRPETDVAVSDAVTEAAAELDAPEVVEEASEDTAPEEATTEIVTEAEEPAGAPTAVPVPRLRPTPTRTTEAPSQPAVNDALNDALSEALNAATETPAAPTGPQLSGSEIANLIRKVSNCWSVGSASTAALSVTIEVRVEMDRNSMPLQPITLVSFTGGDQQAAETAFRMARSAIHRCAVKNNGYALPVEKYDHWKVIHMTFNPEEMRRK